MFAHEAPVCLTYMYTPVAFLRSVCSVSLSDSLCASRLTPQDPATPRVSPAHSPPENGLDKSRVLKKDAAPNSPASVASSGSTPSSKAKDHAHVSAGGHAGRADRRGEMGRLRGGGARLSRQTKERLSSVCVEERYAAGLAVGCHEGLEGTEGGCTLKKSNPVALSSQSPPCLSQ